MQGCPAQSWGKGLLLRYAAFYPHPAWGTHSPRSLFPFCILILEPTCIFFCCCCCLSQLFSNTHPAVLPSVLSLSLPDKQRGWGWILPSCFANIWTSLFLEDRFHSMHNLLPNCHSNNHKMATSAFKWFCYDLRFWDIFFCSMWKCTSQE